MWRNYSFRAIDRCFAIAWNITALNSISERFIWVTVILLLRLHLSIAFLSKIFDQSLIGFGNKRYFKFFSQIHRSKINNKKVLINLKIWYCIALNYLSIVSTKYSLRTDKLECVWISLKINFFFLAKYDVIDWKTSL
jgi:hypothetical protein